MCREQTWPSTGRRRKGCKCWPCMRPLHTTPVYWSTARTAIAQLHEMRVCIGALVGSTLDLGQWANGSCGLPGSFGPHLCSYAIAGLSLPACSMGGLPLAPLSAAHTARESLFAIERQDWVRGARRRSRVSQCSFPVRYRGHVPPPPSSFS